MVRQDRPRFFCRAIYLFLLLAGVLLLNPITSGLTASAPTLADNATAECRLSFGSAQTLGAGGVPSSVGTGNFNGHGKKDIAVANNLSSDVSIMLGKGNGPFQAAL